MANCVIRQDHKKSMFMTSTQEAEDPYSEVGMQPGFYYKVLLFIESVFMLLNQSVLCIPVCFVLNKY